MQSSLSALKGELGKVRSGRAHAGLFDQIIVDYYGNDTPINQIASVSVIDAQTLSVSPWEKDMVIKVDKAIRESDLGLNPAVNGDVIRVPMPALTEERRRELAKLAGQYGEQARVAVRNVRRDGMDRLKKEKNEGMSEDDVKIWSDEVQKLTDNSINLIDQIISEKQSEIMQI